MTDVPILDYAFLAFESEESPKHVAGLQILELPEGAPDDFVATLAEKIKHHKPEPPFNQKLQTPLLGMPKWVEDTDLDLDNHVFYEPAPKPHTLTALLKRLETLHAAILDRSVPLWQLYVFDNLEDRRFAVYFKVHHAYMDGISLSQRSMSGLSEHPDIEDISMPWVIDSREHQSARKDLMSDLFGTTARAGKAALVLPALAKLGLKHSLRMLRLGGDDLPVPFTAPRTAFNTPLTPERTIAVLNLPLERVRNIADHAAVTVNDVLLELCDRAMTRYLDELGEAPDEPLVAQMPVSLRRPGVEQGNQITIAILELGSNETNPVRRLQDIHTHANNVKHEFGKMMPETAEAYTVLMQAVAQLGETTGAGRIMPPLGNVVISNLVGPSKQLYLCGAPLLALYPISTIAPGLAMNITMYTYKDTLHVGLVAGQSAIPDLQPIADYMAAALDELEAAMGLKPVRKRPRPKKQPEL
jgi:WS/DGAT/MGAT family acyltransferase